MSEYIYAVARIRSHELSLLNSGFMEQLLACNDEQQCLRLLNEKGWGDSETGTEQMLSGELKKTWNLIKEMAGDMTPFDVFLYQNDYHNLKAAVKESCVKGVHPGIFVEDGTIPAEEILKAVEDRDFSALPERMRKTAEDASDILLKTRDGQLCDMIIDKAALEDIYEASKKSGNEILAKYGELTVATADIKIAVRSAEAKKDRAFIERAVAKCSSLDSSRLAEAGAQGLPAVMAYLENTEYQEASEVLKKGLPQFECWCDNMLIRSIRSELSDSFGIGPLAAYILARMYEIKTVRIIIAGIRNKLNPADIRERVRETYV
jgi:V/A-type H+-transporting ATPase subunit C